MYVLRSAKFIMPSREGELTGVRERGFVFCFLLVSSVNYTNFRAESNFIFISQDRELLTRLMIERRVYKHCSVMDQDTNAPQNRGERHHVSGFW